MTPYDAAMAGIILAGMVWGAFRGITWQVASIASLVLGYSVSHPLSSQLAPHFPGEPVVARALAMLTIYFAVSGGVFVVAWLVRVTLKRLSFEAFDRHLGMVLGGAEGLLIGVVATMFVVSLAPQTRGPIFSSTSGKLVGQLMSAVGPVMPEEARSVLAPFWSGNGMVADDASAPETSTAAADAPGSSSRRGGDKDGAATPASLTDLIQQEEKKLGKAIAEGATESLKQAATQTTNGGTTERR